MKTTLFALLTACAILAGCGKFQPHIPPKGEPRLYSYAEFPIEGFRTNSTNSLEAFVESPDGWRLDFDRFGTNLTTLVVHHSAGPPWQSPAEISAYQRKSIYQPVFNSATDRNPYMYGLPVHSGHVVNGVETFIAYHYLIYPSGKTVTTLVPHRDENGKLSVDMVAWGAGNWKVNCESVQICLIGNYADTEPPWPAMASLKSLVEYYRTRVPGLKVVAHKEVKKNGTTECPGPYLETFVAGYR